MIKESSFTEEDIAKGFYPLRPIQRWLIDTHFNKAKSTMMNLVFMFELNPGIDVKRLENAINEIYETFDVFRCRLVFHPETSELCQRFDGKINYVKVEHWSDEEFELFKKFLSEPYMMIDKPLYRGYIFVTPSANYLYLDFYHAAFDGVSSTFNFFHELTVHYQGKKSHVSRQYADYIKEELKTPQEEIEKGFEYWREMTKGFDEKKHLPPADLNDIHKWKAGFYNLYLKNIDENFFSNKTPKEHIFFMAATMLTIARSSGAKSSVMSWVHNGRTNMHELRLMGLMLEQYPIAWNFEKDTTVGDFLDKLEKKLMKVLLIEKV